MITRRWPRSYIAPVVAWIVTIVTLTPLMLWVIGLDRPGGISGFSAREIFIQGGIVAIIFGLQMAWNLRRARKLRSHS